MNLSNVPNLIDKHFGQPLQHMRALRAIRPTPGMMEEGENSSAWDVIICLLRVLMAFGWQAQGKLGLLEREMVAVATKDIGFVAKLDRELKTYLRFCATPLHSPLPFDEILQRSNNLIRGHEDFQLFNNLFLQRTNSGAWSQEDNPPFSVIMPHDYSMKTDDKSSIPEQLYQKFRIKSGLTEYQLLGNIPKFLWLKHTITESQMVGDIFTIRHRAPWAAKVNDSWQFWVRFADYQLCAIVLQGQQDNNQLMVIDGDGKELPWDIPGINIRKQCVFTQEAPLALNGGVYYLAYFRKNVQDSG